MADSDFGQLYAELVMENKVSPQLRQIVEDLKLVDNSIRETRKHLEAYSDLKLTNGISDLEKNWRSMRGAISDVQTDIDKLRIKMANLNDAGFGNSSEYKRYEDSLRKLIALKNEMLEMGKSGQTRASFLQSEDVTRFKQELSLSRKEIANTDVAAKHLVDTQRQNVGAVEKMVSQYDKMLNTLKSARQEALDSGMTTMGTQWLQNTINRIQAVSDTLRQALNNPSAITNNMVQQAEQQFSHLEQMAKTHAERIMNTLTAKQLMSDSKLELTKMETHLERIRNRLASFKEDKKITVNTTDLDTAKQKLEDFLNRYRSILNSGNISKSTAKALAAEFNQIAAEAEKAEVKVRGLYDAEKRRLSTTTSPAKPIIETANALRQAQSAFDPVIQKMQQLQSATTRTGVIWEQFKTQIAFTAFSIYGLEHFLKSIITVGGEFERQRVALQNMLGDMREATEIFGQLKNLALESPFTFRQLSTYTKQLAAFSIPYEELYDTNRRLSDMSAGLGVDMSRLILAYGQVRAATVLRGQELRQFTEAGVPMVEKLADYFTKLNGELVTTRDIFTMISKKQVPFEAVRSVMQEMTDEGGMFYNMQAKIADTLSGRWGNLKDAWEILLGEIADGQTLAGTALKTFVEGITNVIRNLRTVLGLLGGLAAAKAVSGLGVALSGAFVGQSSSEKQYLQAKKLVAADLQREAITRKLHSNEQAILMTKNRMTMLDYHALVRSGALDKYQMMILVKRRKITFEMAKQAMLNQGIYMEEIARLQNMSRMELMLRRMGISLKSMLWNWNTAFMAIGAIVGAYIQHSQKLENIRENLSEQAKQSRIDMGDFLNNNPLKEDIDSAEAKRAIEKYEDELKKVAPNFLEIKSRIVGEHGESPQEQAKAYRDELQNFLNNSGVSEYTARDANKLNDRGWAHDTVIEKANRYYRVMQDLRDEVSRIDPSKLKAAVDQMTNMDESTKSATKSLIDQGRKLEALSMGAKKWLIPKDGLTREKQDYIDYIGSIREQLLGGSVSEAKFKNVSDEFFAKLKEDIKNSYHEAFDNEGRWIGPNGLREVLMSGFRSFLSATGADESASKGMMEEFERTIFGHSASTAVDMLANAFIQKNQGLVAKFKASGGKVSEEISQALADQARNIAITDRNFMQNLDYLLNGQGNNEVIKRIRILIGLDEPDLQEWQKAMLEDFGDEFKVVIKAAPDIPSAIEAIEKMYKESKGKMDTFKPLMLKMGISYTGGQLPKDAPLTLKPEYQNLWTGVSEQVNALDTVLSKVNEYKDKWNINTTDKGKGKGSKKTGSGRKEDKELQAWQRHVELYKKFLDQYRELTKMYGEKEALDKLQSSKAYEWVISFAKARGLDATDIDSMNAALNGILDTNKGDKQKRKDAMAKRTADLEAEGYKRAEEALRRLNDQLNEQLKILNDQYDAYKKIFLITGNKEGSMQLAFGGNVTNERYVDELTERLKDALKTAGSSLSIDDAISLNKEEINKRFGEESEAANLINKLKEERNKLEKEYIDILANALTSDMSLEDKRAEAERKYNEELRKLIALRDKAETAEGKAQAQAGIDALNNAHNRNMAGYDQQIFERDTNLGGLMNHLNVLSKGYLRAILVQLRDSMSKYANDNTPEGMAAREKLADQILKVTDALKDLNDTVTDIDDDFYTGGDGKRYITGVTATRYGMKQDQEIDENTETIIRNAEEFRQLTKKINQISTVIKDLENVLKPVLDLFEAIGYEGNSLSQAIELASNALSAASNTTSSLSSLSQSAAAVGNTGLASGLAKAGPYAAVAAVGLSVVSQMFKWQQQAIQDDIDASKRRQQEMEALSSNLERVLERTLGGIYSMRASDAQNSKFSDVLKTFKVYNEGGNDALAKMLGVKGNFWNLWTYSQHDIEPALEKIRTYTKETRDAMQEALSSDSYYDANYASLLAQRDEMQRQLDLENDKKKRDLSAISDLEQNIIEIQDKIQYYALDVAKAIYDIDVKSWADSLAETIVDAWAKGEDAVDAYKKKVKEIMRDVVTNIISQKIIQEALKRANVEGIITSEMEAKNGMLDEFSVMSIGNALISATDQAVGNATKLLDYLKSVGWDLSDEADNASTLGKGIASITEDTADLLASYINAIRADVAAIRAFEERILESGFTDINSNLALQLTELRNISAFAERNAIAAERILEMFDSVTTVGSSGRKVRV